MNEWMNLFVPVVVVVVEIVMNCMNLPYLGLGLAYRNMSAF